MRRFRAPMLLALIGSMFFHALGIWLVLRQVDVGVGQSSARRPPITLVFLKQPNAEDDFRISSRPTHVLRPPSSKATTRTDVAIHAAVKSSRASAHSGGKLHLGRGKLSSATTPATDRKPFNSPDFQGGNIEGIDGSPALSQPSEADRPSRLNLSLPSTGERSLEPKNYADLANQRLSIQSRKDILAEGIEKSSIPDCKDDKQDGGLLSLPNLIYRASIGKCK